MRILKPGIELEKNVRTQIYNAIQGPVVEDLLNKLGGSASDTYWKSVMEGHSFKVEKKLMNNLYDLFNGVKKTLGYDGPIDFYVSGNSEVNAFSIAAEKEGEASIVNINSALVELMTEDELRFVVGHEIGHLINEDTKFRRLLNFVFPESSVAPLILKYKLHLDENLAELIADRYGYMAMPDIKTCVSAFFKMASGLDVKKLDVEVDTFIDENRSRLDYFLKGDGLSQASHPVNPIRVEALNLFAKCGSQRELDKKMDDLIGILLKIGTTPVDKYMPYFIASAGLVAATVDDECSKEEYEMILDSLSNYQMFPKGFLDSIAKQDVMELLQDSACNIINEDPSLRDGMFNYLLGIILADKKLDENEVGFIYDIGTKFFGYSEKEIATMFGTMIQAIFTPDLDALY